MCGAWEKGSTVTALDHADSPRGRGARHSGAIKGPELGGSAFEKDGAGVVLYEIDYPEVQYPDVPIGSCLEKFKQEFPTVYR